MNDISQEQITKRFQALPDILKDTIFSDQTESAIVKSCRLRDVAGNDIPSVGKLTTRVLLGYLRPELFALEIQKETGIDMDKARLVARDLDTEIFSAVRLELKKLYPPTIQTPTVQSWMGQANQQLTTDNKQQNTQPTTYNLQPNPQPKPKYVIPIPEKFLRPETYNLKHETSDQQPINQYDEVRSPTTNNLPQLPTQKATNSVAMGGIQRAETKPQESAGGGRVSGKPANQSGEVGFPTTGTLGNSASSAQRQIAKEVTKSQGAEARPQEQARTKPQLQPTTYNIQPNQQPSFKPVVPLPTFIQTQFKKQDPRSEDNVKENPGSRLSNDSEMKDLIGKFSTSATQKPKPPAESPYREKV